MQTIEINLSSPLLVFLGSVFSALGVIAGAFGAHALKASLDLQSLAVFETAVRYQMYHAFALFIVAWLRVPAVGWLFIGGILIFSGSLYGVSLLGLKWLGAFTPVGGLSFILGWLWLGFCAWRAYNLEKEK